MSATPAVFPVYCICKLIIVLYNLHCYSTSYMYMYMYYLRPVKHFKCAAFHM